MGGGWGWGAAIDALPRVVVAAGLAGPEMMGCRVGMSCGPAEASCGHHRVGLPWAAQGGPTFLGLGKTTRMETGCQGEGWERSLRLGGDGGKATEHCLTWKGLPCTSTAWSPMALTVSQSG